jgi:putative membrane protein
MKRLLCFLLAAFSFAMTKSSDAHELGMMGPGIMGWGHGMAWPWVILVFGFWIAVFAAVVLLIRWLLLSTRTGRDRDREESALDILRKRYARGEINRDEYEERKRDLEK